MKLYRKHSLIACLVLTGLPSLIASVSASTLIWDADGTSGGAIGGTGAWNTAGANFWDNAGTMQSWIGGSADTAVFGGTAGTITLGAPITSGGLAWDRPESAHLLAVERCLLHPGWGCDRMPRGTRVIALCNFSS